MDCGVKTNQPCLKLTYYSVGVGVEVTASESFMAALCVGDAVELLKGGAARPVPARCSHQRRPTTRHGLCLQHRHTHPPPALTLSTVVASQAPSGARAPPGS